MFIFEVIVFASTSNKQIYGLLCLLFNAIHMECRSLESSVLFPQSQIQIRLQIIAEMHRRLGYLDMIFRETTSQAEFCRINIRSTKKKAFQS
jgi:hypothetical protein